MLALAAALNKPVDILSEVVSAVKANCRSTDSTNENKVAQLINRDTNYNLKKVPKSSFPNLTDYLREYIDNRKSLCRELGISEDSTGGDIVNAATDNGSNTIQEYIDEMGEYEIGGGYKRKTTKRRSSKRRSSKRRSSKRRKKYSIKRMRRSTKHKKSRNTMKRKRL